MFNKKLVDKKSEHLSYRMFELSEQIDTCMQLVSCETIMTVWIGNDPVVSTINSLYD